MSDPYVLDAPSAGRLLALPGFQLCPLVQTLDQQRACGSGASPHAVRAGIWQNLHLWVECAAATMVESRSDLRVGELACGWEET